METKLAQPDQAIDRAGCPTVVEGTANVASNITQSYRRYDLDDTAACNESRKCPAGKIVKQSFTSTPCGDVTGWLENFCQSWWCPQCVLLSAQFALAFMHISAHKALDHIPPLPFASFRIVIAIPFLLLNGRLQEPDFTAHWNDVPWFMVMGCFGIVIPQITIMLGNHLAGAAYAAVFQPTAPVFTALLQAAMHMEALTLPKVCGICLTFLGTLILLHVESLDIQSAGSLGLLALLSNCVAYSVYLVILQRRLITRPYPFSLFAGASCVGGSIICLVSCTSFGEVRWSEVPASAWGAVMWAGLGTSFLAHSGIAFAVMRCAAVVPAMYSCLQTVVTAGLSAIWLGQMLSVRDVVSMAIIITGVACVIAAKLGEDKARHAEQAQYQPVQQLNEAKTGQHGVGELHLPHVPSTWAVYDLDSCGHILARDHKDPPQSHFSLDIPKLGAAQPHQTPLAQT